MKKILILGGSSDIGIELIKKFLLEDYIVTAHYSKNKNKLQNLKKDNLNLNLFCCNFSNIKDKNINKLLKNKLMKNHDIIINLIGYIDNKSFDNYNIENLVKSLKINALIPNLIVRNNLKYMLQKKWGRILNCTTIGIKFGGGEYSYNYNLSKHLLEFIPNKYRIWAKKNILINNLRIGYTKTKIHNRMKKRMRGNNRIKLIPMARMLEANEIIEYIYFLSTNLNSYMTGETISVAGGE